MLNIAVCDDTKNDLNRMCNLLFNFSNNNPKLDIKVHSFSSSYDLLFNLEDQLHYDLYILDIILPETNGISLGEKIKTVDTNAILVYMTTSTDYAVDAFAIYAFQYLVKPITTLAFTTMMTKFLDQKKIDLNSSFLVKTKDYTTTLYYNSILYIECQGHIINFFLSDGTQCRSSHLRIPFLSYINQLLHDERFVNTHKSYVVNMNFVVKLTNQKFIMQDETIIPISRSNYSIVKKKYLDYVSKTV